MANVKFIGYLLLALATMMLIPATPLAWLVVGAGYAMGGSDAGWLQYTIASIPAAVVLLIWIAICVNACRKRRSHD